jgi:Tryptophan-rich sensory protein (mitochondrial benzodiazepine receptor homolog)
MKVNKFIVKGVTFNFICAVISMLFAGRINLITVMWVLFTALSGASIGIVYGNTEKNREVNRNKSLFLFILMMVFNVLWMPILYRAGSPLTALIDLVIIGTFLFFIIRFNLKINYIASFITILYFVFVMYIVIINITFIF